MVIQKIERVLDALDIQVYQLIDKDVVDKDVISGRIGRQVSESDAIMAESFLAMRKATRNKQILVLGPKFYNHSVMQFYRANGWFVVHDYITNRFGYRNLLTINKDDPGLRDTEFWLDLHKGDPDVKPINYDEWEHYVSNHVVLPGQMVWGVVVSMARYYHEYPVTPHIYYPYLGGVQASTMRVELNVGHNRAIRSMFDLNDVKHSGHLLQMLCAHKRVPFDVRRWFKLVTRNVELWGSGGSWENDIPLTELNGADKNKVFLWHGWNEYFLSLAYYWFYYRDTAIFDFRLFVRALIEMGRLRKVMDNAVTNRSEIDTYRGSSSKYYALVSDADVADTIPNVSYLEVFVPSFAADVTWDPPPGFTNQDVGGPILIWRETKRGHPTSVVRNGRQFIITCDSDKFVTLIGRGTTFPSLYNAISRSETKIMRVYPDALTLILPLDVPIGLQLTKREAYWKPFSKSMIARNFVQL